MSSREDILGRVREKLGRNTGNAAAAARDIDAWLAARRQGPRPHADGDLLARFRAKSEALSTTIDVVANDAAVPAAVARYLEANGLPKKAVGWPSLESAALWVSDRNGPASGNGLLPQACCQPWRDANIQFEGRGAVDADLVGITGCFCAIAETGTLMLLSGPDTPASVSLLPETHVAIVAASRIVAGMEEAWALLRAERGTPPRAVNFISGPSRTGDIEQTIVLGAHGPYRVHVVIVLGV